MQGCCAHAACLWSSTCSMGGGHVGRTRASACWWPLGQQSAGLPGTCSQQNPVAHKEEHALVAIFVAVASAAGLARCCNA